MGLLKSLVKFKFYVLIFGAGYLVHGCVQSDERYAIKRVAHTAYLVDKLHEKKQPLQQETFQLGDIAYRVKGLLAEKNLTRSLEELTKQLEDKK